MAWVRTDGRKITDDPALLQQGKADIALCHADLDAGSANETARTCMAQRGYALVQKDQAEEYVLRMPPPLKGDQSHQMMPRGKLVDKLAG